MKQILIVLLSLPTITACLPTQHEGEEATGLSSIATSVSSTIVAKYKLTEAQLTLTEAATNAARCDHSRGTQGNLRVFTQTLTTASNGTLEFGKDDCGQDLYKVEVYQGASFELMDSQGKPIFRGIAMVESVNLNANTALDFTLQCVDDLICKSDSVLVVPGSAGGNREDALAKLQVNVRVEETGDPTVQGSTTCRQVLVERGYVDAQGVNREKLWQPYGICNTGNANSCNQLPDEYNRCFSGSNPAGQAQCASFFDVCKKLDIIRIQAN